MIWLATNFLFIVLIKINLNYRAILLSITLCQYYLISTSPRVGILSNSQARKLGHSELSNNTQDYTAAKWWNWDSNPCSLDSNTQHTASEQPCLHVITNFMGWFRAWLLAFICALCPSKSGLATETGSDLLPLCSYSILWFFPARKALCGRCHFLFYIFLSSMTWTMLT